MDNILRKLRFWWMYRSDPPWESGISPPELMKFIHENEPGKALDLGCGTGTNVITLAHYGWEAHGIDFIPSPIRRAKQKADQAGIETSFAVDDVTNPASLNGTYDLILDMGCFHSLSLTGKKQYQQMIRERLAPGGTFLLYGFVHHPEGASITDQDRELFSAFLNEKSSTFGGDISSRQSVWLDYQKPRFENGIN